MKVVFFAYDFVNKVGGPNAWLLRLVPALKDRGVEVKVLFMTQDQSQSPTAEAMAEKGVPTVVVEHFECTEQKVLWVLEQLQQDLPDIFVPNLAVPAFYAAGWARRSGIPTVGILHSDDSYHKGVQEEFVFGDPFYRLSGLACVSDYILREVMEQKPENTEARKLPYGAPLPAETANPPDDVLKLAYVGRLEEEQKRISELTSALCRAVREVPGVEATIFGEGSARNSVEDIIATEGKGLPVKLAGKIPSDEIQGHLLQQHVLVLLSDYEGLPIALMEAMACGLVPVCKSISSGIPELIDDGVNGLLVNDRDVQFVAAVKRLKDEPELWKALSKATREKMVAEYSHDVCADGWYAFLKELCRNREDNVNLIIPDRIKLPPVKPLLAREDFRAVPLGTRMVNKLAGLTRKILGHQAYD